MDDGKVIGRTYRKQNKIEDEDKAKEDGKMIGRTNRMQNKMSDDSKVIGRINRK
jgi:hypothetical protein